MVTAAIAGIDLRGGAVRGGEDGCGAKAARTKVRMLDFMVVSPFDSGLDDRLHWRTRGGWEKGQAD